jgi:hypothetical protein
MTVIDVKGLSDLIKSVGPTDEQRQTFGRTFLGSLLGQATILAGMMLVYVATVVLLWRYALDALLAFHAAVGPLAFWSLIATPVVAILLFDSLPTAWRALRERRLKATVIGGDVQFKLGYFRLHPYGAADRETFKRLDGADATILNWLKSGEASLLYLSGASGVGKSSLLGAKVLPQVRDAGWTVVETRLFGDPIQRLRAALLAADSRLARERQAELPLQELLKKAAELRSKKQDAPLLLVVDQFEEFLILHREEERQAFAALLDDLVKNPIDGLRILLVFRSDYRPLVFKLDLPPLVAGQNWQELAPYDRGEATTFLQSGGRELSPQAIDGLFRGLDRIEDARGMYRPITLNMVGLVLERMGHTLERDPRWLIQSYLTDCLTTSESRDFAKPLLAQMITDAGTKEPRTEEQLAKLTGFAPWQVKATLADLARHGLVRRLEAATAVWEIAHDFLARTIGQLIGRLKPSVLRRARPLVAPLVLTGWIALAVLALPAWMHEQERLAKAALQKLGATFGEGRSGGSFVQFPQMKLNDDTLIEALPHLARIGPLELNLSNANITSLEPLKGLTNLSLLSLSLVNGITSLEPLKGLTNLSWLDLSDASGITSLEPLKGLTNLSSLNLSRRALTHLPPNFSRTTGITSLEPLKGLTKLSSLDLSDATGITSLEPLKGLTNLSRLDLSRTTGVTSLEPLKGLTNLSFLNLAGATGITSLEPLKGLTNLKALYLGGATGITSLEPLKGLTNLSSLSLNFATGITSLEPLKGLTNLSGLTLGGATGITSLEPLRGLTNLSFLNLAGATGITSLEPLKGKNIEITGASDQLLATWR